MDLENYQLWNVINNYRRLLIIEMERKINLDGYRGVNSGPASRKSRKNMQAVIDQMSTTVQNKIDAMASDPGFHID